LYNEIKEKLKNVKLIGGNLGETDNHSFLLISEHFDLGDEETKCLNYWEKFYFELFDLLLLPEYKVNFLPTGDDKVNISTGQPFHCMAVNLQSLRNISISGLVASEWFGILESENEAYLCTFLDTLHENVPERVFGKSPTGEEINYMRKYSESVKNFRSAFGSNSITLFFDMNNPIMKMLMNFDFFEYLKIRNENKDKLKEIYPSKLIDLYENVVGAENFRFSSKFHNDNAYRTKSWLAIPLGIPPMLINGICINSKFMPQFESSIEEISTLFPNATIFNENKEVITYPLNMSDRVVKK